MNDPAAHTLSIALCTYNGATYLPTQWQSLLEQDRLPDEVVICDDRSTDTTVALLHELAAAAPFRVRIEQNAQQLGYNKNFERALSLCTGDLILLCDQDDFWMPAKISTMADHMARHPATQIAFCNAWMADEHLNRQERLFWQQVRFDETTQARWRAGEALDVLLDGNRMMGAASIIRRSFLPTLLPIPAQVPGYIYDGWLALVAAAHGAIDFVDVPLQLYRTHPQQQVGVRETPPPPAIRLQDRFRRERDLKLKPLRDKYEQLGTLYKLLESRGPADTGALEQIRRRLQHYAMRSSLPDNRLRRLWPVLDGIRRGNYHRYADASANGYAPYVAALGDLFE